MKEYIIPVIIEEADKKKIIDESQARGRLNSRTIVDGEGNIGGFGGEHIVQKYLPFLKPASVRNKEYVNFDFVLPNGKRVDVKSKGNCKVAPTIDYDCTIPVNQKNQQTDFYIFTRISSDVSKGWICGIISKKNFFEVCKLRKKGEPYNNMGRKTVEDVYVCSIKDLKPISILKNYYEK
jgi:hypothetical protein